LNEIDGFELKSSILMRRTTFLVSDLSF
jgi:hypothetical protein